MLHVDDKPETLHIYVVRDEVRRPQLYPIFLSVIALASLVALSIAVPYEQPVTRAVIRVPAVLLPIRTFTATAAVISTGIKTYPATTAHGVLTITNGSVISQTIPQGFRLGNVITDTSVFVPAGSANGYGWAQVRAHALLSGRGGNLPPYSINSVEGSSIYIRNLSAFSGGADSYSVKYVSSHDKHVAVEKARGIVALQINELHYPCKEVYLSAQKLITMTWRCQFLSYSLPLYMHVTSVKIIGKNLLIGVWFVVRPVRIGAK